MLALVHDDVFGIVGEAAQLYLHEFQRVGFVIMTHMLALRHNDVLGLVGEAAQHCATARRVLLALHLRTQLLHAAAACGGQPRVEPAGPCAETERHNEVAFLWFIVLHLPAQLLHAAAARTGQPRIQPAVMKLGAQEINT